MSGSRRRAVALALAAAAVALGTAATGQPARAQPPTDAEAKRLYRWKRRHVGYSPLAGRFEPPAGYRRVAVKPGSYAHWLRHLPLLPAGSPVRSYRGRVILPPNHRALAAVVDLDLSQRDRQQCADTAMRLRGEYWYQRGEPDRTRFRWAGGKHFGYEQWRRGIRPVRQGKTWRYRFERAARPSRGYRSFRRYLEYMFAWTGSIHQAGEPRVKKPSAIQAGDFFIQGGSPGHVVIVLDLARNDSGRMVALIGQGFMPAQDMHVLRPAGAKKGSPWFVLDPGKPVDTPLWYRPFRWSQLRRFRH